MADFLLLLEAEKRGLLSPEKASLLQEARSRGLVPGSEPQEQADEKGFFNADPRRMLRGIGLTGRAALSGVGLSGLANLTGLPQPETSTERIVQDVAGTMAGGGAIGAGAKALARGASSIAQPYLNMLAANQGQQALASAGAGLGGGMSRESGGTPYEQQAASLFGGIVAPTSFAGIQAGGRKFADIGAVLGAGFGNERATQRLAKRAAQDVAGTSRGKIIAALSDPDEYVSGATPTVAEAIAGAQLGKPEQFGSATVKLQKDLTGALGIEDILPSALRKQQVALEAPVARMAGGNMPRERAVALGLAEENRNAITGPIRETALRNANIAGVIGPQLERRIVSRGAEASQAVEDLRRLSKASQIAQNLAHEGRPTLTAPSVQEFPGMPRVAERYGYGDELAKLGEKTAQVAAEKSLQRGAERRFAEMQLGSLEAHGLRPLEGGKIVAHIDKMLTTPGDRAVSLNQKILGAVRDKIAEVTAMNRGQLDAHDLYAIRKTDINDIVNTLTKDADASTKMRAAALTTSIKSRIDDAIEAAGGSGWKDYLAKYAKLSNEIDQMRVSGAVLERMRSDAGKATPGQVLRVLGSGEEALLKRSVGVPRYEDISEVFKSAPDKLAQLRAIESHMQRSEAANRMALQTQGSNAANLVSGEIPKPPTLLSRPMMAINFALKMLQRDANAPVAKYIAEAMQDPQAYAALLQATRETGPGALDYAARAALATAIYDVTRGAGGRNSTIAAALGAAEGY